MAFVFLVETSETIIAKTAGKYKNCPNLYAHSTIQIANDFTAAVIDYFP